MKKRITSLILAIVMIITVFPTSVFAEVINRDNKLDVVNYDSTVNNKLFEIQALNSKGEPLVGGHMNVYSYLEGKTVGNIDLDENGKALFIYQPSKSIIEKELSDKSIVDVHYAIFITNGKEVYLDGFTQTYYSPDFIQEKYSIKTAANTIMTDKVQPLSIKTEMIENVEGLTFVDTNITKDLSALSDVSINAVDRIVETRSLGSKMTDFASINTAVGCKAGASIEQGTKTTISGANVISASFTASSSLIVSQETPVANNPYRHYFYTWYNYVEEKHEITDEYGTYTFYRIRATGWNGGINYSTYLESKNGVSPDSVSWIASYGPNSTARLSGGTSFTVGAAANLTGPISGSKYSLSLTHQTFTNQGIWRVHGNTTYYEYGSGKPLVERYITRY